MNEELKTTQGESLERLAGTLEDHTRQLAALREEIEELWDELKDLGSALNDLYDLDEEVEALADRVAQWEKAGGDAGAGGEPR